MVITVTEPRQKIKWSNIGLILLMVLAVAQWAYIIGQFSTSVQYTESMEEVAKSYHLLTIYEDGSYKGTTSGGMEVTGCITGRVCEK